MHQLKYNSYLSICTFQFSFVPIDLPTVSACTVFCTYMHILIRIRCTCTVHTVIVHLHICKHGVRSRKPFVGALLDAIYNYNIAYIGTLVYTM